MNILKEAQSMKEELIANRRYLHQCPEIGFELDQTVTFIKEKLKEMGIVAHDIGDHGLYALIGEGEPCILLRADMDALPMEELSGLPFASTNKKASHCCGHDTHMTMLLGAAKLLKAYESELKGTVKLFFQPAEEPCLGGKAMVEAGILNHPHVDVAFGMHSVADYPVNHIYYTPGVQTASSDFFRVTIKGQSCHGAAPHKGIDPIVIASHLVLNLQNLSAREVDAAKRFTLTFGSLHAGSASNIIASDAILEGSIRTFDKDVRSYVKQRFVDIIEMTAKMFNGEADVQFVSGNANVINDQMMIDIIGPALKKQLGDDFVSDQQGPVSWSEDYSFISEQVPSLFIINGAMPEGAKPIALHDQHIIFDEEALVTGAAAYTIAAMSYLSSLQD